MFSVRINVTASISSEIEKRHNKFEEDQLTLFQTVILSKVKEHLKPKKKTDWINEEIIKSIEIRRSLKNCRAKYQQKNRKKIREVKS